MNHKLKTFFGYLLLTAGVLIVAYCGQCTIRFWAGTVFPMTWDELRDGFAVLVITALIGIVPIAFGIWLIVTGWVLRAPETAAGKGGPDPAGGGDS